MLKYLQLKANIQINHNSINNEILHNRELINQENIAFAFNFKIKLYFVKFKMNNKI